MRVVVIAPTLKQGREWVAEQRAQGLEAICLVWSTPNHPRCYHVPHGSLIIVLDKAKLKSGVWENAQICWQRSQVTILNLTTQ